MITANTRLSISDAETLFADMLDGAMDDGDITHTLTILSERGESAEEIAGAVRAMRKRMLAINAPANAIDVCGTGGDGQNSLNVSTAVSLIVASCGVPVAKHGNRAASSRSGAADTLEALGLNLTKAGEMAEQTLEDLGIAFLFAQSHHPALVRVAPIRKALARRTIFNLVGPLCNPASVRHQLLGVASPTLVPTIGEALSLLKPETALVVSGDEGLDEISIAGSSTLYAIGLPQITNSITPEQSGIARQSLEAIRGGDAYFNAEALKRLLQGETSAYRDAVLLNSAAALLVAQEVQSWEEGVEEAREALDKGLPNALLECWIDTTR